jgi:WD40 repeat protein
LWNIDLRTKVTEVTGHNHPLRKVIPLTKCRLAWCAQDQMVRLWNLKERVQENEIKIHSAWINDLCRLSDNLVASCSRDHTVAVFDVDTGKPKYVIKDETYVTCLCLVT